ncbi:hypothetical protein L6452_22130 [Arctium lappa]|uniref:Uncharacterized protein n=1 Tax=Arctium lappa TaxID=4217 RepID=A0ACB9AYY8_ARCLA|nr:hypothetical protein L6452_22130 [Arctium lappa]
MGKLSKISCSRCAAIEIAQKPVLPIENRAKPDVVSDVVVASYGVVLDGVLLGVDEVLTQFSAVEAKKGKGVYNASDEFCEDDDNTMFPDIFCFPVVLGLSLHNCFCGMR